MSDTPASHFAPSRARVLVAVKRADAAIPLLRHALVLATGADAKVWALHVIDRKRTEPDASGSLMSDLEAAESWLRRALVESGLEARGALPVVVVGRPAREILAAIRALDADAVLLGSESRETDAEGVGMDVQLQAPCPVVFHDLLHGGGVNAP